MNKKSRRNFIQQSAVIAGAATAVPAMVNTAQAASHEAHTLLTSAKSPYVGLKIIDTDAMPWPKPEQEGGWEVKVLYENEKTGDHLIIIQVGIGAPGGTNHYHTFHEWAYWLSGDFVNNEYTSPYQRTGPFQQFREGIFLDRPAYSLHGGEEGRLDSQVGGTCLIMEEGGRSVGVIPEEPGYNEEFKQVKQWSVPRIIDTLRDMPWEAHHEHGGVQVKYLVEDQERGFRATLWRLPRGWDRSQAPQFGRAAYYRQAHQFNFLLNGDLRIHTHATPDSRAKTIDLGKSFSVECPPMSIVGLADGVVSDGGCVWLQVTYAKGTSISNMPIEEPTYL
jgi:hypothetical protein